MWVVDLIFLRYSYIFMVILHIYHLFHAGQKLLYARLHLAFAWETGDHCEQQWCWRENQERPGFSFSLAASSVLLPRLHVWKHLYSPNIQYFTVWKRKLYWIKVSWRRRILKRAYSVILTNGPSRCDLVLYLLYLSNVIIKKKQSHKNKRQKILISVSLTPGASSMIFWCLLWTLQSLSNR